MNRSYTILDYLKHRFESLDPEFACPDAMDRDTYQVWHRRFVPKLRQSLGRRPDSVPLNPEKLVDLALPGIRAEKIVFDSSPAMSVPAWILLPEDLEPGQKRPAVFLIVGHSGKNVEPHGRIVDETSGKAWGVGLNPDGSSCSTHYHNDIGQKLCRAGFIVYCQDFLGFGERAAPPHYMRNLWTHSCNLLGQALVHFDELDLTGVHFHDLTRGLDYLQSRPDVNSGHIGMIGNSLGGMWTNLLTAVESRVQVAVSCCSYPNFRAHMLGEKMCLCAGQTIPGMVRWTDAAAVMAAIAPRPLLMQVGKHDSGMSVQDARSSCDQVQRIYEMLGHGDRCAVDVFEGVHEIHTATALAWFQKWLRK